LGLTIDRTNFYPITDKKNIHRENDGSMRLISKADASVYKHDKPDNIDDIKGLQYTIDKNMINISAFEVNMKIEDQDFYLRDNSREGTKLKIPIGYKRKNWSMSKIYN
jgi:hypothetical protein